MTKYGGIDSIRVRNIYTDSLFLIEPPFKPQPSSQTDPRKRARKKFVSRIPAVLSWFGVRRRSELFASRSSFIATYRIEKQETDQEDPGKRTPGPADKAVKKRDGRR